METSRKCLGGMKFQKHKKDIQMGQNHIKIKTIYRSDKIIWVAFMLCHVTAGGGLGGGSSGPAPVRVVYQPPPWVQMTTPAPPSQAEKGPEEWALPQKVNLGNARTHLLKSTTS